MDRGHYVPPCNHAWNTGVRECGKHDFSQWPRKSQSDGASQGRPNHHVLYKLGFVVADLFVAPIDRSEARQFVLTRGPIPDN